MGPVDFSSCVAMSGGAASVAFLTIATALGGLCLFFLFRVEENRRRWRLLGLLFLGAFIASPAVIFSLSQVKIRYLTDHENLREAGLQLMNRASPAGEMVRSGEAGYDLVGRGGVTIPVDVELIPENPSDPGSVPHVRVGEISILLYLGMQVRRVGHLDQCVRECAGHHLARADARLLSDSGWGIRFAAS